MRFVVVGNPGSRRVALFAAAAARLGLAAPDVIPWLDVAGGAEIRFPAGSRIRIESPGEDAEVDRLLRGATEPTRHGEIVGGRAWYAGFAAASRRIEAQALRQGAHLTRDVGEMLVMFDKAATHARLSAAGAPVPPALPDAPTGWADLRRRLREVGWSRVFVKPAHGSSASGVIALHVGAAGRVLATTSVEIADGRLYNSLRVRRYEREADVAQIVDALAPDGLHVERWFPKADLDGRVVDLRVVVIDGEPVHVVVRGSRSPMTNLHLGGARGDLGALMAAAGKAYADGLDSCRRAAACFPSSPCVGVDLMFRTGWRSHAIAEVNAFGDLLPGLLVNGRDTYEAQLSCTT